MHVSPTNLSYTMLVVHTNDSWLYTIPSCIYFIDYIHFLNMVSFRHTKYLILSWSYLVMVKPCDFYAFVWVYIRASNFYGCSLFLHRQELLLYIIFMEWIVYNVFAHISYVLSFGTYRLMWIISMNI